MDDPTRAQVEAAAPGASTWLSANAGSGKTRVLTDRVARLLLEGAEPQNILCLTYTKAAAAEMQNRLFSRLGEWSMKPVEDLRRELAELGADGGGDERLAEARRLFARAIETPGGLRIQTIHSYCASLLRRFPLEAGVSPNFVEMDDRASELLRGQVIEDLAERSPDVIDDVATRLSGDNLDGVAAAIAGEREAFDAPASRETVLGWFGLEPDASLARLVAAAFDGSEPDLADEVQGLAAGLSKTYAGFGAALAGLDLANPDEGTYRALCDLFLYKSGDRAGTSKSANFPQSSHTKAVEALAPVIGRLHAFMDRIARARAGEAALLATERTAALHAFAAAFLPAFDAEKRRRGWLDFDDLILKARALLSDPAVAGWVLYRLDGGLDHILVDEAQDTSPEQWQVIERLAQEIAAGAGARDGVRRTIFVVGDKKQSIYSFQGADPREFDRMRDHFAGRLEESEAPLRSRELRHSFRSSDAILRFVDQAVGAVDMEHIAFWKNLPGRVDVWPAVPPTTKAQKRKWYDPVDIVPEEHGSVVLARAVADFMERTIGRETIPGEDGQRRPVRPSDFLVLVRRRSDLFEEIIRACKARNLPLAGADRLRLAAELAVKDLSATLAFLATEEDDLSLAAALKSPLFGWDEGDLYGLAANRGKASLWRELRRRAEEFPETHAVLADLRGQVDYLRPHDLLERILTRHDGRRRLLARLGSEAEDGIDALLAQSLDYERVEAPSLTGFVAWLQTDDVEVKRDLGSAAGLIRVMTVHGAKGLEAPIVILPDTAKWSARATEPILRLEGGGAAWRMPAGERPPAMERAAELKDAARDEEQERLLYVAATRAKNWLVFAAAGDVGDEPDESWHGKAMAGLEALGAEKLELPEPLGTGRRFAVGDWDAGEAAPDTARAAPEVELPGWLREAAPPPGDRARPRAPSDLGGEKALSGGGGQDEEEALAFGSMVHRILEEGPDGLADGRAERVLAAEWPGRDPGDAICAARAVLDAPEFSFLFAEGVLSEASLSAELGPLGRFTGALDKLVVGPEKVTAVDFKTNAAVPGRVEDTPDGLLRQMGAYQSMLEAVYPDRKVEVAILWTATATLMAMPRDLVLAALDDAAAA